MVVVWRGARYIVYVVETRIHVVMGSGVVVNEGNGVWNVYAIERTKENGAETVEKQRNKGKLRENAKENQNQIPSR